MAKLTLNFADAAFASNFDAVPAGEYRCLIESANMDISKSGNPTCSVMFSILDEDPDVKGRKIFNNVFTLVDAAMFTVPRTLKSLNIPYKEVGFPFSLEGNAEEGFVYEGMLVGEKDAKGKNPFLGFVLGNGKVYPLVDNIVNVNVTVVTLAGREDPSNNVTSFSIVGEPIVRDNAPANVNSGQRSGDLV